jgi:prepilin-type processing-associated H-X9-DG protein
MTLVVLKVTPPGAAAPKGNLPRKNKQPPKGGFAPVGGGFVPPFGGFPDDIVPQFGSDLKVVVLLAFNSPFDPEAVRKAHAKGATQKKIDEREFWEDPDEDVAIYFPPGNTAMAIGDPAAIRNYLIKLKSPAGPLSKAIEHAQKGGRHFVAAIDTRHLGIPVKGLEDAPGEFASVGKHAQTVLKAESLMLGVALTEEGTKVDIRARYKDDAAAAESETALRELAKFARTKLAEPKKEMEKAANGPPGREKPRPLRDLPGMVGGLLGLGAINSLDDWLADPPLKTDGSEVVFTPKVPSVTALYAGTAAASVALLLPATQKVRESATRMKDSNNLKQLGLAMHEYHDARGTFPPQDSKTGPEAKGGLSWRVHVLPYIGEDALYKQFKLDEPWDSEHNRPLANRMPTVFASPFAADPPGMTRYKVFAGTEAVVYPGSKTRMNDITDGTSNTFLIAGGGKPVIWTKPEDIEATPNLTSALLTLPNQAGCNVCMCDGSVRWFDLARLTPDKLKAAITRAGGEVILLD